MDRVDYESLVIQDLLNFYNREELNISPWYQRRSVWNRAQKAYLINTLFESKPVPSIYIRHAIDLEKEKSVKEVVDGQQRVRCLLEYKGDEFAAPHPEHVHGVKFSGLNATQKKQFLLTSMSVGYLIDATDQDVMEIFARINSVAKTLNPQEKRNAQYAGEFKQFCLNEAIGRLAFWRAYAVFTDNDLARMAEVQFVSDLVMNLKEGLQDFSATRLTTYYKKYDDSFPGQKETKALLERLFTALLEIAPDVLRGTVFCRPQVLFSLMMAMKASGKVPRQKLERCISEIDSRVQAMRAGDNDKALPVDIYEAFTTGNMHRIKFRKKREAAIVKQLA